MTTNGIAVVIGSAIGGFALAYATGIASKAGEDTWTALKRVNWRRFQAIGIFGLVCALLAGLVDTYSHSAQKPATRGDVAIAIASVGFSLLVLIVMQINVLGKIIDVLDKLVQPFRRDKDRRSGPD